MRGFPAPPGAHSFSPCNLAVCGFDMDCRSSYGADPAAACKVRLTGNRLSGAVPPAWTQLPPGSSSPTLDANCLVGVGNQVFCPPPWLAPGLAAGVAAVAAGTWLLSVLRSSWGLAGAAPLPAAPARVSSLIVRTRRELPDPAWLAALVLTSAASLLALSPAYDRIVHAVFPTETLVGALLVRNLAPLLAPSMVATAALALKAARASTSASRPSGACAWTLVASVDALQDNLSSVRAGQVALTALFFFLLPVVSLLNFWSLPLRLAVVATTETPIPVGGLPDSDVTLELSVETPRLVVAMVLAAAI